MTNTIRLNASRYVSIDALRGIIMVVMALDHVRYFFHQYAITQSPENLRTTYPFLFFTRWITHFCAPVFIFLAGLSARLLKNKGVSEKNVSNFLVTRGLLLIAFELTIFRFAWDFNFWRTDVDLLVIWAIGVSMLFLSMALYLPDRVLFIVATVIVCCHNLLDNVTVVTPGLLNAIWKLLHQPGSFDLLSKIHINVLYPVLPYFGLICLGYFFGRYYTPRYAQTRKRILRYSGISMVFIFLLIRAFNLYGDPGSWAYQDSTGMTIVSFLKTTKYPMSLDYLLMTLGPSALLLSFLESSEIKDNNPLVVIGKVPMFYYIMHLFLIHGAALLTGSQNKSNLLTVYLVWISLIIILFFLCKVYMNYKFSHKKNEWLKYL